jgi:hypothetical protein
MKNRKEKNRALLLTAETGESAAIEGLLEQGANVNARNWLGRTPLIYAARDGHTDVMNILLDRGARLNLQEKYGWTALMFVCPRGRPEVLKMLLDRNARIDLCAKDGATALILAARRGNWEIVEMLLNEGADPDTQAVNGDTALMLAARRGYTDTVNILLRAGADPHLKSKDGRTALMRATARGQSEAALLLEKAIEMGNLDKPASPARQDGRQDRTGKGHQAGISGQRPEISDTLGAKSGNGSSAKEGMVVADYTCREAEESDFPGITALLSNSATGKQLDWARWKFLDNPDGQAWIYVAVDSSGKIMGFNARLPRRFTSAETGDICLGQIIDIFVATEVRRKGVYAKLALYAGGKRDYLMFGIPNELSRPKIKNDLDLILPMETWQFPAAIGRILKGKAAGFLAPLANTLCRLYTFVFLGSPPKNVHMITVKRFERGFDLDPAFIHGTRSAEYLNWRFIDNPTCEYLGFEFFLEDDNIGYCVYSEIEGHAKIYDLVADRHPRQCLRLLVDHCRASGLSHLKFEGVGLRLRKFGFISRSSRGECVLSDVRDGPRVPQGRWYITLADKD